MEELKSGKTVLKRITKKENGRDTVVAEVIYGSEDWGYVRRGSTEKPVTRTSPEQRESYRKFLEEWRKWNLAGEITEADDFEADDPEGLPGDMEIPLPGLEPAKEAPVTAVGRTRPKGQLGRRGKKGADEGPGATEGARGEIPEGSPTGKKRRKAAVLICVFTAIAVAALAMVLVGNLRKKGSGTVYVTVYARDIRAGETLDGDCVTYLGVPEADLEGPDGAVYIDALGNAGRGTPVRWEDSVSYRDYIAAGDLKEGDIMCSEDFVKRTSDVSGTTRVTLIAIISSDSMDEDVTLSLGTYVLGAGSLEDILASDGSSVLDRIRETAETEETEREGE